MKKHLSKKRVVLAAIIHGCARYRQRRCLRVLHSDGRGHGLRNSRSATTIVLTPTITGTLYPAGAPASVSVVVKNNGSGAQYVNLIHLASIHPRRRSLDVRDHRGRRSGECLHDG